ncbi:MAG TPA: hypothetical protein DCX06_12930 [Opitutae bacterium]|nr:hypothetical protein [Opitutae bacterium]
MVLKVCTIFFAKGLIPHLDYTDQVERQRFDKLLLDHAIVAANIRLTFGIRWRYTLFKRVCRLNQISD